VQKELEALKRVLAHDGDSSYLCLSGLWRAFKAKAEGAKKSWRPN
jgi:hypothetical protein